MTPVSQTQGPLLSSPQNPDHVALHDAAVELEATFLAEMLKSAGLGENRDSFGGGAGEDQFSSFLIRAQAQEMANSGGIGLAESLYNALLERAHDT